MLRKAMLLMILLVTLIAGCVPTDSGAEPIDSVPNSQDGSEVELRIRVQNETPEDLAQVTLIFANSEVQFLDIPAGQSSEYQSVAEAYQSVAVELGEGELRTLIEQAEEFAEPPITAGSYIYQIHAEDNLAAAYVDLVPDPLAAAAIIDPIMEAIFANGVDVELQLSIQRGTPFDAAYGETISGREILLVNNVRVDIFYFASEEIAATMAAGIEPGGTRLTVAGADGTNTSESLQNIAGTTPNWWHQGRFLIMYPDDTPAILTLLNETFSEALVVQEPGTLEIRIANLSGFDFADVTVNFGGQDIEYGELGLREFSAYRPVAEAYRYGSIEIEAEGGPYGLMAIDYVGETPLPAGRYTYFLSVANGEITQTMIADDNWYQNQQIVGTDWYWVDSNVDQKPVADGESEQGSWPYLNFSLNESLNDGEAGWQFGGFTSCNGMGGTYFSNPDNALVINSIFRNTAGCRPEVAASAAFFTEFLTGITYLRQSGEWLFISDSSGTTLSFTTELPGSTLPYARTESAALAPVLQQLGPGTDITDIRPWAAGEVPQATAWELIIFDELVTVLVYDDADAVTSGRGFIPEGRSWTYDRFRILYNGDYDLIDRILDDSFTSDR